MIRYRETFSTRALAEAFVAHELREYHPLGYGTDLRITECSDGTYLVTGSRSASCD